jgi:hypothetical protein
MVQMLSDSVRWVAEEGAPPLHLPAVSDTRTEENPIRQPIALPTAFREVSSAMSTSIMSSKLAMRVLL